MAIPTQAVNAIQVRFGATHSVGELLHRLDRHLDPCQKFLGFRSVVEALLGRMYRFLGIVSQSSRFRCHALVELEYLSLDFLNLTCVEAANGELVFRWIR